MNIFNKFKNMFNSSSKSIEKYDKGLKKTRVEFISSLTNLSKKYEFINDDYFEELENILISADMGVNTVVDFVDKLRVRIKNENIVDMDFLKELIVDELFIMYVDNDILSNKLNTSKNTFPTVILVVGVNGVGKTTTIGKLAYKLKNDNKKVLLIAADTFRAGAIEQLKIWGEKAEVDVYYKEEGSDPSSVVFEGLNSTTDSNYDYVIIDTAGRLQNKTNLMNELEKINKVIQKFDTASPHETFLVIDSTVGQNGINQAKQFKEITNITGLVLTKLDGTSKGGIMLQIKEETNIPIKYVCLGEKIDDIEEFDIEKYIYGLFKDLG